MKKYTWMRVLSVVLVLVLCMQLIPSTALAALLDNDPAYNAEMLEALAEVVGSEDEAARYYALLEHYGLLDEDGNLSESWEIWMDGEQVTLDDILALLDDPGCDLSKQLLVDGRAVSLGDIKTILEIEEYIEYLRETYFTGHQWTTEQQASLQSLMDQIASEGIVMSTESAGSEWPSNVSHNARVSIGEPTVGGTTATFTATLTGALEGQVVTFDWVALSGSQPVAPADETNGINCGSVTLAADENGEASAEFIVTLGADEAVHSATNLAYAVNLSGLTNALFENGKTDMTVTATVAAADEIDGASAKTFSITGRGTKNFSTDQKNYIDRGLVDTMEVSIPKGQANYVNGFEFSHLQKWSGTLINAEIAANDGGPQVFDLQEAGNDSYGIDSYYFWVRMGAANNNRDITVKSYRVDYSASISDSVTAHGSSGYSYLANDAEQPLISVDTCKSDNPKYRVPSDDYTYSSTLTDAVLNNVGNSVTLSGTYTRTSSITLKYQSKLGGWSASGSTQISPNENEQVATFNVTATFTNSQPPTVESVSAPAGDYYPGQTVPVVVTYNEPVNAASATVTFSDRTTATALESSGYSNTLTFPYTVPAPAISDFSVTSFTATDTGGNTANDVTVAEDVGRVDYTTDKVLFPFRGTAALVDLTAVIENPITYPVMTVTVNVSDNGNLTEWLGDDLEAEKNIFVSKSLTVRVNGGEPYRLISTSEDITGGTLTATVDLEINTTAAPVNHIVELVLDGSVVLDAGIAEDGNGTYYKTVPQAAAVFIESTDLKPTISVTSGGEPYTFVTDDGDPTIYPEDEPTITASFTLNGDGYSFGETEKVTTFDADGKSVDPNAHFAWSSSDTSVASITAAGVIEPTGKAGSTEITLTALNGGVEGKAVKVTATYTVDEMLHSRLYFGMGLTPYLNIASDSITAVAGSPLTVFWASNIVYKNDPDTTTFTVTVTGGDAPHTATVTNASSYTIPADYLKYSYEAGASHEYTFEVSTTYGGTEYDDSVTIKLESRPAVVTLDGLESYYVTDTDGAVDIAWHIENFDLYSDAPSELFKFEITKDGESVYSATNPGSGTNGTYIGSYSLEPADVAANSADPASYRDVYTVTIQAKNGSDSTWSYDSFLLYVYDADALKILVDGKDASSVTMSNIDEISKMSQEQILALKRDIYLKNIISINYGEYAWTEVADRIAWSSDDNTVATVNYQQGTLYENVEDFSYEAYRPTTEFGLSGIGSGEATVTATHMLAGMSDTLSVTVETLENRLYLFQCYPQATTTLTYTNGDGETKTVSSDGSGAAAIYEASGITSDVYCSAEVGGVTYLGTFYLDDLVTGEGDWTKLTRYPLNSLDLRRAAYAYLYIKKPDGTPYTGAINFRGGVYVDDEYKPNALFALNDNTVNRHGDADNTVTLERDGKLTVTMDQTQWGLADGKVTPQDDVSYVFEIAKGDSDDYYPMLIAVDANVNSDAFVGSGEAIVSFRGSVGWKQPFIIEQSAAYSAYGTESDMLGEIGNVGPSDNSPVVSLTNSVMWWGEDMSGFEPTLSLVTEGGLTVAAEDEQHTLSNDVYPFTSSPVTKLTVTLNDETMQAVQLERGKGVGLYLDYYRDGEKLSRREPLSFRLFNLIGLGNVENAKSLSDMLTTMGGISGTANSGGAEKLKSDDRFVQVAMELVASDSFNEGSKFNLQIVPTSDPTKFLGLISVQVGNIRDDQQVTGIYAPSSSTGDFDVDYMPGLSEMMVMSGKRSIYSYLGDDINKVFKRESVRNLKAQLGGYAESLIYFNEETYDWEIQILSGGFNMGAGVTYSWNFHTMAGPVPFTATLTIGGNFEVSMDALSVAYYNVQKDKTSIGTDFLTELRIYLFLHFFAGVGIDYAIIAFKLGIYGQISVDMRFQWLNRPYMDSDDDIVNLADGSINEEKLDGQRFKIDGQIGLMFVVRFLFFNFEQILFSYSFNLLDKTTGDWNKIQTNWEANQAAHQSAISTLLGNGSMTATNVGEGQMLSLNLAPTVESRDYLADGSFWNDGSFSTFALDSTNATENLQYNSYPYANPVLTDDGEIIVYLDDMASTDVEDTRASFAVRNEFGMYNAGRTIDDNGFGDSQVSISGTESFAVAAWTRQTESIDKDAGAVLTAEDQMIMMNGTETYVGIYDGSNWVVERLTVNHSADLAPVVATNGSRAIVAWRSVASSGSENGEGVAAVTDFNEKDTILYSIYDGAWSAPQTLYNGTSGAVKGLVAEMLDDGTAAVAYTLDTDGDGSTVTDREIYYAVVDKTSGEVARNVRATSDAYLDENPQLAAVTFPSAEGKQRFVLGWYTEQPVTSSVAAAQDASTDGETLADIRLLDFDGAGNYTQLLPDSINRAADAYDVSITPSFRFTKNAASINDLSIIWAERAAGTAAEVTTAGADTGSSSTDYDLSDLDTEKDVLKGVKFYTYGEHGELVSFTGAIDVAEMPESTLIDHFDAYVSDASRNEIKAVILGTTYGEDADLDDYDGIETRVAETVGGNTVQFSVPSSLTSMYTATETYEDKIDVPAVLVDYETVRKGANTQILFTIDNLGIHAINKLDITVGTDVTTYDDLNLLPGGSIQLYADYTVPTDKVVDANYTVNATFDESVGSTGTAETTRTTVYRLRRTTEDLTSVSGTAYLDLPDVEITDASIIAEENGERTILIKLNNDSDASLAAANRFVRVSFYTDATYETPLDGLGSFDITDAAELAMIDDGGYSTSVDFDVEAYLEKLSEDEEEKLTEIPDSGITVYIKAEVMETPDDGSDAVTLPEPKPSNNFANVVCENLKTRTGENVSVTSDLALSDGGAAVTVSLRNNRLSTTASGNVIVFLLDEDGKVLAQRQSYDPSAANRGLVTLGGEEKKTAEFTFTAEESADAASVEVIYSDLIIEDDNAALASLSFSGMPNVSLADFAADPTEPNTYRHSVSVEGLGSTTVLAVAESATASLLLGGEDKGTSFFRETVSLPAGSTRDIEITVVSEDGTQMLTYILTVEDTGSSGASLRRVSIANTENGTVTADSERVLYGRDVTLTVTPDEGYAFDTLTVTDSNGNAVALTDNGDGTYTFTMPHRDVTVIATFKPIEETPPTDEPSVEPTDEPCPQDSTCPLAKFVDVDQQAWYHDALHFVLERGLMIGTSDTEFEPLAPMTRAMIVTILHRLEGEPTYGQGKSGTFVDVPENMWYTEAVEWAAANGIVEGHGDGTFDPDGDVTREQLAAILYRYAMYKGIDVSVGEDTNVLSFDDAFDVSDWAYPALQWACAVGIIEGKPSADGGMLLDPQGSALRCEVAAMLMRLCEHTAE